MKKGDENKILIETGQLARGPREVDGEVDGAAVFALEGDPVARARGPLKYRLRAELTGGGEVVVTGEAEAGFELLCGRCARFFSTNAKIGAFLRAYAWEDHPEAIDATADVRDELLLELPGYPLCGPDCKGLCPRCGKNLNEGPCGCPAPDEPAADGAWGALDGWTEDGGNGVRK